MREEEFEDVNITSDVDNSVLSNSETVGTQSSTNETSVNVDTTEFISDIDDTSVNSTPHLNPDWLKDFTKNFYSLIVEACSKKVGTAVDNNLSIDKPKEKREIKLSIIHSVLDYIQNVFGGVGRPRLKEMRIIAAELGYIYPAMFKDEDGFGGYGLGGSKGLDALPNQMLDMLRGREGARNKDSEGSSDKQVGKRKWIYGKLLILNWIRIFYLRC